MSRKIVEIWGRAGVTPTGPDVVSGKRVPGRSASGRGELASRPYVPGGGRGVHAEVPRRPAAYNAAFARRAVVFALPRHVSSPEGAARRRCRRIVKRASLALAPLRTYATTSGLNLTRTALLRDPTTWARRPRCTSWRRCPSRLRRLCGKANSRTGSNYFGWG